MLFSAAFRTRLRQPTRSQYVDVSWFGQILKVNRIKLCFKSTYSKNVEGNSNMVHLQEYESCIKQLGGYSWQIPKTEMSQSMKAKIANITPSTTPTTMTR